MAKFSEIIAQMKIQNEGAAVDISNRIFIGILGVIAALAVLVLASDSDKLLAIAFLVFPVIPVACGIVVDYFDAKRVITEDSANYEKV